MRLTALSRITTTVLVLLVTATVAPGAAHAEASWWNITDEVGDARRVIDIKRTLLDSREAGVLKVKIEGAEFTVEKLNFAGVYFDVVRQNAGPEYRVSWALPKDGDGVSSLRLRAVDDWTSNGSVRKCAGLEARVSYARDVVRFRVPRNCINKPKRVRWAVRTARVVNYKDNGIMSGYWDFVPGVARNRFIKGFWVG